MAPPNLKLTTTTISALPDQLKLRVSANICLLHTLSPFLNTRFDFFVSTEEEAAPDKAPKKKRKKFPVGHFEPFEDKLPCAEMYERSYMHRDVVTHTVFSKTQFLITGSKDGFIKFWKKQLGGVEFAKQYRAHLGKFTGRPFVCVVV